MLTVSGLKAGLARKNFSELAQAMPTTVEGCLQHPPICQLKLPAVAGVKPLKAYIEAELIKLAAYMNVAHNFTSAQIVMTADTLIEEYPAENLADITLVCRRLARGYYGPTYHQLDCSTVCMAMAIHIEEKSYLLDRENVKSKKEELLMAKDFEENWQKARDKMYAATAAYHQARERLKDQEKTGRIEKERHEQMARAHRAAHPPRQMSPEEFVLRQLISSISGEKYNGLQLGEMGGFGNYPVKGFHVFARNAEEAAEIFHQAEVQLELARIEQRKKSNPVKP